MLGLYLFGCGPGLGPLPGSDDAETYETVDTGPHDTGTADTGSLDTGEEVDTDPPPDCPDGVVCIDTFPSSHSATTTGGARVFDTYGCAPQTDESGPEIVYRVRLAEEGFLALGLRGLPSGVDVDVHLLDTTDPDACIDRGHWRAGALLPAGDYTVVVDSWVDDEGASYDGAYTLDLGLVSEADLELWGLQPPTATVALRAFDRAWLSGETDSLVYTVNDFTELSTTKRLWTFDLLTEELLYREYVSHGEGSGDPSDPRVVASVSNTDGTHASSVGLVRTAETYWGSNGYSLRLDGLEPGFNDNVRDRAIVVHGADYASQDFIDDYGYLGRSWGCPAVDMAIHEDLIDTIAEGGLMLTYFDDPDWLDESVFASP